MGQGAAEIRVARKGLDGERELVNRAYAVFVALDEDDRPTPIPPFTPVSEEEKREYAAAQERRRVRLRR